MSSTARHSSPRIGERVDEARIAAANVQHARLLREPSGLHHLQ